MTASLQQLFTSRKKYNASTFVAHKGIMFYDETNGFLRIGDGVTPGGHAIGLPIATTSTVGGIKIGPGMTVGTGGLLTIDAAGLPISFGDFYANANNLSTVNANEDFNIISNGTGVVNTVGEFHIHTPAQWATNQDGAIAVLTVNTSGYVTIRTPSVPTGTPGALSLIGSSDGSYMPVAGPGGMLHITGNPDTLARVTIDGFLTAATGPQTALGAAAGYGTIAMRTARGTPASPLPVLADDLIGNYSALGWVASSSRYSPGQVAGLQFFAAETFSSSTATGTYAQFRLAPTGSNTGVVAATIRSTGITAANFTGSLTGNADTATKLATARNINGVAFDGTNPINVANTQTLTIGTGLTGTNYNGSAASTIALNTATLMSNAVNATTATNAGYAYSFNTGTLVTNAVQAGVVTTAAQPAITSVGTLTNLAIDTGGTITTPRVVINDGGLRTVSGGTTCTIDFATDSIILWTAPSGTAAITLQNYTAGAQVKLIIALTTTRDITYGISSAANSSTGADNWNGTGAGNPIDIANTAVHLEYTCISAVAGGCYVKVTAN